MIPTSYLEQVRLLFDGISERSMLSADPDDVACRLCAWACALDID